MIPILYTIGNYNVYAFGFFLALSFLLSTFVVWKYSKDEFKEEDCFDAYLYGFMTAVISARLIYILRNFSDFGFHFLQYILVTETPGLSLMGGALGGFLFLLYYSRKRKLRFWHILDIFSLSTAVSLVLIKIGQQLGGAAFGRETDFFLKIRIVGLPNFHHPAEFYEAFLFFNVFLILVYLYKISLRKKWPEGTVFAVFGLCLGLIVFALEFLKVYRVYLYGLSVRQYLALAMVTLSCTFLIQKLNILNKINRKNENEISA